MGSALLLNQFSLERGDLLLGLRERGRRAADLRDKFVNGGAVHCSPHAQSRLGDTENCIAEKVNQRLTLKTAKAGHVACLSYQGQARSADRPQRRQNVNPIRNTSIA